MLVHLISLLTLSPKLFRILSNLFYQFNIYKRRGHFFHSITLDQCSHVVFIFLQKIFLTLGERGDGRGGGGGDLGMGNPIYPIQTLICDHALCICYMLCIM